MAFRPGHFRRFKSLLAQSALCGLALALACIHLRAQQASPDMPEVSHDLPQSVPPSSKEPAALQSIRGTVRNSASGEPLPRVLVQAGGGSGQATLTDGEGRFELTALPPGLNVVQLTRPGFRDTLAALSRYPVEPVPMSTHAVFVTAGMRELAFTMRPLNAIRGQIELSTGDSAQGISVQLVRRQVVEGRGVWRIVNNTRANADGVFRFAGLEDGEYCVFTEPSLEGDVPAFQVQRGDEDKVTRSGFPLTYFPDARDFSTAAHIVLRNGDTAQANIRLTLEPFHLVRAVIPPQADSGNSSVTAVVNDPQGHQLSYPAQYDADSHSVQTMLPDGAYTLRVSVVRAMGGSPIYVLGPHSARTAALSSGQASFTVAGHNLRQIRLPLSPEVSNPLQVNVTRTAAQQNSARGGLQPRVYVMVSQAGPGITDGFVAQFADGPIPGDLQTTPTGPGAYWVHTTSGPNLCESSFTAGGANLAREPLVINSSGSIAPLTLSLRDDCASLQLVLPANLPLLETGEEMALTAYIVPDFDSTADASVATVRPSSGGNITVQGFTPGSYHVYAFPAPVALEYRNRDVLATLPGQQVTLEPSGAATLVLEAPAQ